jgi:hypothetical protein
MKYLEERGFLKVTTLRVATSTHPGSSPFCWLAQGFSPVARNAKVAETSNAGYRSVLHDKQKNARGLSKKSL